MFRFFYGTFIKRQSKFLQDVLLDPDSPQKGDRFALGNEVIVLICHNLCVPLGYLVSSVSAFIKLIFILL